jgi:hypothetical protein
MRFSRVPVLECGQGGETYPGQVLDLSSIDLEEIANALADQTDYEHHWLINPDTGPVASVARVPGHPGPAPGCPMAG